MEERKYRPELAVVEDFSVIDECDDWIVLGKPAPLLVHPTGQRSALTLLGGVEELLRYEAITGNLKLSIINRLDRETSGVVLMAKNKSSARYFGRAMERRLFSKQYLAMVVGWPEWDELAVDAPIVRRGEVEESDVYIQRMVHPAGRESTTQLEVVDRFERADGKFSLVRVFPKTGRTHQIRVHLAHVGYPIVGDKIYGPSPVLYQEYVDFGWSADLASQLILPRQALHCEKMSVQLDDHQLEWVCPLTADLQAFLHGQ
ncbi:RluA family pseudouridine synthase [Persicirhabdus sediminis]|uniref:RNA pseudouridine synthase n=1 Tax=Persicirhabdus sediminis TaxID=454144 RepID=A0A8J7MBK0_9BACT|nr:RNA pseudouridine synthase [Persicirhabdus sediminis]MBK1790427.1 RNA pseudouridine synthase [Persicirhabdus sediminis]